jgi:hypothetical protein
VKSENAIAAPVWTPFSVTASAPVTAGNGNQKCRYPSIHAAGNGVTALPPKSPMCARVCAYAQEIIVTAVTPLPALFHAGFKVTDTEKHRYRTVTERGDL